MPVLLSVVVTAHRQHTVLVDPRAAVETVVAAKLSATQNGSRTLKLRGEQQRQPT